MIRISQKALNHIYYGFRLDCGKNLHNKIKYRRALSCMELLTSQRFCATVSQPPPNEEKKSIVPKPKITDSSKSKVEDSLEENDAAALEASWRTMKYTLIFLGITITCGGTYLISVWGKPEINEHGKEIRDEFSSLPMWQQYVKRSFREAHYYVRLIQEPAREKLLPDVVQFPYIQPKYTIVLEFTDVLVHPEWTYSTGWRFKKRPGIDYFLENLNGLYEIVIYTGEQGMTVFPIIEALDPQNLISYKLVRDSTHFSDGHRVKNLGKLNRDLSKVIVLDWNLDSVKFHTENVFLLQRWEGKDEDSTLIDLVAFLKTIADSGINDVREVLKYYSKYDNPLAEFREKQKLLMDRQEAESKQSATGGYFPSLKKWGPTFSSKFIF